MKRMFYSMNTPKKMYLTKHITIERWQKWKKKKGSKWSITKFKNAIPCTFSLYTSNFKEIRKVATYTVFDCNPWLKWKRFYITMILDLDYDCSNILYNFDISQQLHIFVIGATSLSHIDVLITLFLLCINHSRV